MRPDKRTRLLNASSKGQSLTSRLPSSPLKAVVIDKRRIWCLRYHLENEQNPKPFNPATDEQTTTVSNTSDLYFSYLSLRMDGSSQVKLPATALERDKVAEAFESFNNWLRLGSPMKVKVHAVEFVETIEDPPKFPNAERNKIPSEFTAQAIQGGYIRTTESPRIELAVWKRNQ